MLKFSLGLVAGFWAPSSAVHAPLRPTSVHVVTMHGVLTLWRRALPVPPPAPSKAAIGMTKQGITKNTDTLEQNTFPEVAVESLEKSLQERAPDPADDDGWTSWSLEKISDEPTRQGDVEPSEDRSGDGACDRYDSRKRPEEFDGNEPHLQIPTRRASQHQSSGEPRISSRTSQRFELAGSRLRNETGADVLTETWSVDCVGTSGDSDQTGHGAR